MKKQHGMLRSLVLVGALAGVLGVAQGQTQSFRFASEAPRADTQFQAATRMNEVLKAKTNGALDLKIFTDSQLGTFQAAIAGVRGGTIDMAVSGSGNFTGLESMIGVFDIPYLFKDSEHAYKVLDGPVGMAILAKLEPLGLKGLAFWDNGFKSFSANKPLKVPDDFKGQKMRIQSSKVLEAQMRSVGALPQVMAFSEVYQALQTGVVDGTENPHSNLYSQKMHEVQKYVTVTDHGYLGYAVIVNKKFWDGLPPDVHAQLDQAMKEATDYANKIAKEENDVALENVKKSGKTQVLVPTPQERLALKKTMAKVHKEMESRIGKEMIEAVYKETGFDPNKL